jgi:hypothetical protein
LKAAQRPNFESRSVYNITCCADTKNPTYQELLITRMAYECWGENFDNLPQDGFVKKPIIVSHNRK